ncbi:MAG: hypothetical protein AAFQ36_04180 [Pseudomonadota bacterium]
MSAVTTTYLNPRLFGVLDDLDGFSPPEVDLRDDDIDLFLELFEDGRISNLTTLSSRKITLEGRGFELEISGSGIGPVKNLDRLISAIENGRVSGELTEISVSRRGEELFEASFDDDGFDVQIGGLTVGIVGDLPDSDEDLLSVFELVEELTDLGDDTDNDAILELLEQTGVLEPSGVYLEADGETFIGFEIFEDSFAVTLGDATIEFEGFRGDGFDAAIEALEVGLEEEAQPDDEIDAVFDELIVENIYFLDKKDREAARIEVNGDSTFLGLEDFFDTTDTRLVYTGNNKRDAFQAGAYDDVLDGRGGRDLLIGAAGDDELIGGGGRDTLRGGSGSDTLTGGKGKDVLHGGADDDTFAMTVRGGRDKVKDFSLSDDQVDVSALGIDDFDELSDEYLGGGSNKAVISGENGERMTLKGVDVNDLTEDNFIF